MYTFKNMHKSNCYSCSPPLFCREAEFLDEIQTKILRGVLLAITQSPLQLCLEISIYSNSRNPLCISSNPPLTYFYSSISVHCKWERRKTWQKTIPPSHGLRNSYRKKSLRAFKIMPRNLNQNSTFVYIIEKLVILKPNHPVKKFALQNFTKIFMRCSLCIRFFPPKCALKWYHEAKLPKIMDY
jgi:hypothetical protein